VVFDLIESFGLRRHGLTGGRDAGRHEEGKLRPDVLCDLANRLTRNGVQHVWRWMMASSRSEVTAGEMTSAKVLFTRPALSAALRARTNALSVYKKIIAKIRGARAARLSSVAAPGRSSDIMRGRSASLLSSPFVGFWTSLTFPEQPQHHCGQNLLRRPVCRLGSDLAILLRSIVTETPSW
jgi:hypothetical protein